MLSIPYLAIETIHKALEQAFPERFLVTGSYANQAWLKQWTRPINDLDMLDTHAFNADQLKADLKRVLSALTNEGGLDWQTHTLTLTSIFELSTVPGVRSVMAYSQGGEQRTFQLDIAKLDPLTQPTTQVAVPSYNGGLHEVRTVAPETAAAWKLHGLFEHMDGHWQPKSLLDLYHFIAGAHLESRAFRTAVLMAFRARLDTIGCLSRVVYGDFGRSEGSLARWADEINALGWQGIDRDAVFETVRNYLKAHIAPPNRKELLTNLSLLEHRVHMLHALDSYDSNRTLLTLRTRRRVLSTKAYHRIGHIPGSQTGSGDRTIHPEEAARLIATCPPDCEIIVQEKLDGTSVAAFRQGNKVLPLGREGDHALVSANRNRRLWAGWVAEHQEVLLDMLQEGERLSGEWLAMTHSVRYLGLTTPFFAFDIFDAENKPVSYDTLIGRLAATDIPTPRLLHRGGAFSIEAALTSLTTRGLSADDPAEGAIWRLEEKGVRKQIAKYVHPGFEPGRFLEERTGQPSLWNWTPNPDKDRYTENTRLTRLMVRNGNVRVIGFDDSPHRRHIDAVIDVHGIVTTRATFEGMITGQVEAQGLNSTFALADMVLNSKFMGQVHAILIDGITFAFNTVDLPALFRLTGIPVIAVMRNLPNFERINAVIEKYCENVAEYQRIYAAAGEIFPFQEFYYQSCGLSHEQAHFVLQQTTVNGNVPEPLRIAHLIGSAIKTGQSFIRAL